MKVAILTNFQEFLSGYSLTGIVLDQCRMLREYGHDVHLFVCERFNLKQTIIPEGVIIEKKIPFAHLTDYRSKQNISPEHQATIAKMADMLRHELKDYDIAFTHDFVFTGWNLPHGMGCIEASKDLPNVAWLHWIHSVPTAMSDWWDVTTYGKKHRLVFPNFTTRIKVAEQYRGTVEWVRCIPHIKDLRSWFDFNPLTQEFIAKHPGVMRAEVVQIYPASGDRLEAKRTAEVIKIFGNLKKRGASVCLVVANQWATTNRHAEDVEHYLAIAEACGLIPNEEVIFTSKWRKEYRVGLPHFILRELMMLGNLFIFPTREESFGLVLPEASLSGGAFCVINKSLDMMYEVSGGRCIAFDFGSHDRTHNVDNPAKYWEDLAFIILGRMRENEAVRTKTFMRRQYNWNNIYDQYYLPVMAESKLW